MVNRCSALILMTAFTFACGPAVVLDGTSGAEGSGGGGSGESTDPNATQTASTGFTSADVSSTSADVSSSSGEIGCVETVEEGSVSSGNPQLVDAWVYWSTIDNRVHRYPIGGGGGDGDTELLLTASDYRVHGDRMLYVSLGEVRSADLDGNGAAVLASDRPEVVSPVGVGTGAVYWLEPGSGILAGALVRWDAASGEVREVLDGLGNAFEMTADDTAVFVLAEQLVVKEEGIVGGIVRYDDVSGAVQVLAEANIPSGLVRRGDRLYWVDAVGEDFGFPGSVRSIRTDGTDPQVLVTIEDEFGISVDLDDLDIFYSTLAGPEQAFVYRVDRSTGQTTRVFEAAEAVLQLVLTPQAVYVTSARSVGVDDTNAVLTRICR